MAHVMMECIVTLMALVVVLHWHCTAVNGQDVANAADVCYYEDSECMVEPQCVTIAQGECVNMSFDSDYASAEYQWTCTDTFIQMQIMAYLLQGCAGTAREISVDFPASPGQAAGECFSSELFDGSFKFSSEPCPGPDCFPAFATVALEDGSLKTMRELQIGDRVQVSASEFSPLVFWGHRMPESSSSNYIRVELASGRIVVLSAFHLAYVNGKALPANSIRVGDMMRDAILDELMPVVSVVPNVKAKGLFNPHTASGDLVVDGVVVSCYGVIAPHLAHALLVVERFMHALGLSALGSLLENQTPQFFKAFLPRYVSK